MATTPNAQLVKLAVGIMSVAALAGVAGELHVRSQPAAPEPEPGPAPEPVRNEVPAAPSEPALPPDQWTLSGEAEPPPTPAVRVRTERDEENDRLERRVRFRDDDDDDDDHDDHDHDDDEREEEYEYEFESEDGKVKIKFHRDDDDVEYEYEYEGAVSEEMLPLLPGGGDDGEQQTGSLPAQPSGQTGTQPSAGPAPESAPTEPVRTRTRGS